MKTILNYLGILLIGITIGIVCSLIVRSKLATPIQTIIKYDTIRITEPQAEKIIPVEVRKFTTVPTLLTITDTIKVPYYVRDTLMIPIEQRYYAGESYKAWVSGYNPRLDSIVVYNTIQTISQIKGKYAENRLSIEARFLASPDLFLPSIGARYSRGGLFAEVGGMYHNGIKPYLQVGYSLTLFER